MYYAGLSAMSDLQDDVMTQFEDFKQEAAQRGATARMRYAIQEIQTSIDKGDFEWAMGILNNAFGTIRKLTPAPTGTVYNDESNLVSTSGGAAPTIIYNITPPQIANPSVPAAGNVPVKITTLDKVNQVVTSIFGGLSTYQAQQYAAKLRQNAAAGRPSFIPSGVASSLNLGGFGIPLAILGGALVLALVLSRGGASSAPALAAVKK